MTSIVRIRRWAVAAIVLALTLGLGGGVTAQDGDAASSTLVEDALFGIRTVAPSGWTGMGNGIHVRGDGEGDTTVILQRSAPISNADLWPRLLPQIEQTEIPEQTGALSTADLDWSLHAFTIDQPTGGLNVEVAVAEDDGTSYLIIFQAATDEFDALRELALVPALAAFAPIAPEPTVDPATLGYSVEEVRFRGGAADVDLAGTLSLPPGPGPHPVVVLMSGSGLQDRDEALTGVATIKPFALIADALTSAGVGVLRYDDRGAGSSTGESGGTIEELTEDGAAALDYLVTREDVDPERLGLLGHSEGGIYAARIGARDPRVAFIVMMAGPAVDGVSLLIEQTEALARSAGESEAAVAAVRTFAETGIPAAREADEDAVEAAGRTLFGTLWDMQPEAGRAALGPRDEFIEDRLELQAPVLLSDWYRSILAYDPAPDLAAIDVPMLALYGGLDMQVLSPQNEPAFVAATVGNDDATAVVLPDANHLFQAAETGSILEYGQLADDFTPEFLPTLVDWVVARTATE